MSMRSHWHSARDFTWCARPAPPALTWCARPLSLCAPPLSLGTRARSHMAPALTRRPPALTWSARPLSPDARSHKAPVPAPTWSPRPLSPGAPAGSHPAGPLSLGARPRSHPAHPLALARRPRSHLERAPALTWRPALTRRPRADYNLIRNKSVRARALIRNHRSQEMCITRR